MHEFTISFDVRYYETDQMAVVHHSNYVRYFETARVGFLSSIGINFADFERSGFYSPVIGVNLKFISPAKFGDTVTVKVKIKEFRGIRLYFDYTITNQNNVLLVTGESSHTFCDTNMKPVNIRRAAPDIYEKLYAASI